MCSVGLSYAEAVIDLIESRYDRKDILLALFKYF